MIVGEFYALLHGANLVQLNGNERLSRSEFWHKYRGDLTVWTAKVKSISTSTYGRDGKNTVAIIDIATIAE